jgi:hypothetical protein
LSASLLFTRMRSLRVRVPVKPLSCSAATMEFQFASVKLLSCSRRSTGRRDIPSAGIQAGIRSHKPANSFHNSADRASWRSHRSENFRRAASNCGARTSCVGRCRHAPRLRA